MGRTTKGSDRFHCICLTCGIYLGVYKATDWEKGEKPPQLVEYHAEIAPNHDVTGVMTNRAYTKYKQKKKIEIFIPVYSNRENWSGVILNWKKKGKKGGRGRRRGSGTGRRESSEGGWKPRRY